MNLQGIMQHWEQISTHRGGLNPPVTHYLGNSVHFESDVNPSDYRTPFPYTDLDGIRAAFTDAHDCTAKTALYKSKVYDEQGKHRFESFVAQRKDDTWDLFHVRVNQYTHDSFGKCLTITVFQDPDEQSLDTTTAHKRMAELDAEYKAAAPQSFFARVAQWTRTFTP